MEISLKPLSRFRGPLLTSGRRRRTEPPTDVFPCWPPIHMLARIHHQRQHRHAHHAERGKRGIAAQTAVDPFNRPCVAQPGSRYADQPYIGLQPPPRSSNPAKAVLEPAQVSKVALRTDLVHTDGDSDRHNQGHQGRRNSPRLHHELVRNFLTRRIPSRVMLQTSTPSSVAC